MNDVRYIKSFSRGQITIPKDIRDVLGLTEEFWLKLSLDKGKIVAEPVTQGNDVDLYKQKLLKIEGDWFIESELAKNRASLEKKLKSRSL